MEAGGFELSFGVMLLSEFFEEQYIFLSDLLEFYVVLLFERFVVLSLSGKLVLKFVELLGDGFDAILEEYFIGLGLASGVDEGFEGLFELEFGLFKGLVFVLAALQCYFEVLLQFGLGMLLCACLIHKNLLF